MRVPLNKIVSVRLGECLLFATAVLVSSVCCATVYQDSKCQPIAAPVTSCECPLGENHPDRCEGSLPKNGGTMYGDVGCQLFPGTTCTDGSGNQNDCGRVAICTIPQGTTVQCKDQTVTLPCTIFTPAQKTPCVNTWGNCTYPP